jgi:hypothetical protein
MLWSAYLRCPPDRSGPARQHEIQMGARIHQQRLAGHERRALRTEEDGSLGSQRWHLPTGPTARSARQGPERARTADWDGGHDAG